MKDDEKIKEILRPLLARIGDQLAELRKQKGYKSYENFAFDNEIPRGQYWRLERGQANMTLGTLIQVLIVHDLTVEEFFSLLVKEEKKSGHEKKPTD